MYFTFSLVTYETLHHSPNESRYPGGVGFLVGGLGKQLGGVGLQV
jgi:hypothetical protein